MKPLREYTEAEIRAMESSRELDALVASVLGWTSIVIDGEPRDGRRVPPRKTWTYGVRPDGPTVSLADSLIPNYSTDPGEAFKALSVACTDYQVERNLVCGKVGNGPWWVESRTGDVACDICIVICLAALAAHQPNSRA